LCPHPITQHTDEPQEGDPCERQQTQAEIDGLPASGTIQVKLTLKDAKTSYRVGEGIMLDVSFNATEAGHGVQLTDGPLDMISISPPDGVVELDSAKSKIMSCVRGGQELSPGTPFHMSLPINAFYRFEKPRRYSAHVTTRRVWSPLNQGEYKPFSEDDHDETIGITTNDVSFDILEMSDAEEQDTVEHLMGEISPLAQRIMPTLYAIGARQLKSTPTEEQRRQLREDMARAEQLGKQLGWLTGDPSTRAKANIILHPEMYGIFLGFTANGLETARNQTLLVTLLEEGMRGSANAAIIAPITAELRAKLDGLTPEQTKELEQQYLRRPE
jgi:hypothetical protein